MIDTLLITYYFERTGYFTLETFLLWATLIIAAGIGTLLAWRSFGKSLLPVQDYLANPSGTRSPPVPCSLDEIGQLTAEWGRLILGEQAALAQVQASETRFSGLVDALPLGVLECDQRGIITFVNAAFCNMHDCKMDGPVGKRVWDMAADSGFGQTLRNMVSDPGEYNGSAMTAEGRHDTKSGGLIDVRIDWAPRRNEFGEHLGFIAIITDITERKKAAEELVIRDVAIRRAGNAIAIADMEGRITFANDTFLSLFGLNTLTDVIGQPIGFQWQNQDAFGRGKETLLREGFWRGELVSGGNGRPERIVDTLATIARSEIGAPLCIIGSFNDVTEQRAAEKQIRELNQNLEQRVRERTAELEREKRRAESYLNVANTMIIALDPNGDIQMVNDKGCQVLGWPRSELVGGNWFESCIPEDDRHQIRQVFGHVMDGRLETVETFENAVITRTGDHRIISWHNTYLRDDDGRIKGCLSAGQDVTEARAAAEKLETNERRFSFSRQFAGIAVWEWNIQTGALYWSEQIAPLIGYSHGEVDVTYDNFLAVIHPEDREAVETAIAHCLETGQKYEVEHRIIRADNGEIRWVLERGNVVHDHAGQPHIMVGVAQDVTARKVQEEALRHAQKIESLGNLAGGVAHSLNNLLLPVTMLTRMVIEDSNLDAENKSYLAKVVEASDRAKDLVGRILAFSRFDTPSLAREDMVSLVGETVKLARSTIPSTIELIWEPPSQPQWVTMDSAQIEAVLMNILNNSACALEDRSVGKITLCLDEYVVGRMPTEDGLDLAPGPHARLTIADNGAGMDASVLARIFDPFFTTKPVGKGTGLGMSMAHGIIKEHNGDIIVESQKDLGTTVKILLPHARKRIQESSNSPAEKKNLESHAIDHQI